MAYSIASIIDEFGTATTTFTSVNAYTLASSNRVELVVIWYGDATNAPTGVSDTQGNTWTAISGSSVLNFNGDGVSYEAWECKNVTVAGSTNLTATFTAATSHAGFAGAIVSGLNNSAAAQTAQQGQTNPGTTTDLMTSGLITPTTQPAMLFGFGQGLSSGTRTAGTGFTSHALPNASGVNGGVANAVAEDKRLTSTSSVAATFTDSVGTADDTISFGIVVPESASTTAYTLSAATGFFSLAGEIATRDLGMPVVQGAFSLIGHPVTAGYGIAPTSTSFNFTGNPATLAWSGAPSGLADNGTYKKKPIFQLSAITGLTRWVDYIPVQFFNTITADKADRFDYDGAITVKVLTSVTGLRAWVDYIPVFVTTDPIAGKWRYDDAGFLPIVQVN